MHEKKEKGDVGVAFTIARLTELGWSVCIPLKEHASYDLIAEKGGECMTIQVRYTSPKNGALKVKLKNSWADSHGNHTKNRKVEDFDVLAIFCPTSKTVFFLQGQDFENSTQVNLRLSKTKNNQAKNVRMAEDFVTL